MNFTLFNRIKPQPKQEETPSPQSWDAALEVSRDVEETVLLAEAPAAPVNDGPTALFPHVAVGAPEPRRITVTTGETHETQTQTQVKEHDSITPAPQNWPQVHDPQEVNLTQATQAELVSKIAAVNEEVTAAAEPEVTPTKEDTVGWFTVLVSLFFGLSVFMFKHAAALVITFLTYVDPETEAKWTSKRAQS